MPKKWPKARKPLQKMSFSNLDIAVMAKLVDVDKMEAEAAAAKWMKDNEKKWKPWVNAARTQGPSRGPKPQNGPSEMAGNFFRLPARPLRRLVDGANSVRENWGE